MHGFNPHHPKNPSYYPLLAHVAQTGQILRLKNRPGNVHDSKGAAAFLRELLGELRARFGPLAGLGISYGRGAFLGKSAQATSPVLPMDRSTGRSRCTAVLGGGQPEISCFETRPTLKSWALDLQAVVFRKRVAD